MLWATYKATCRRSGVYAGASGPRDFNAELFELISKQLATGWESAFERRLPYGLHSDAQRLATSPDVRSKAPTTRCSCQWNVRACPYLGLLLEVRKLH
ncbi:hypothetical protein CGLO_07495 [Colletotrichum gloeosporioides Cg-14]|uniref:DUF7605 domain-containing protein n=1 Tax=Colletotrichum gloeosporioides (strain Cg-14) TaxID=1237896 RepID=T0LMB9_COLGC|nr:hypothetical protein CGLO_07495 [Colletotrichum gloeosporioides Cg-14]